MNKSIAIMAITLAATTALTPAFADDPIKIKPIVDLRLRWEDVSQATKLTSDAVTVRARLGFEAQLPGQFSLLAEATGTAAIDNDYFNATPVSGLPNTYAAIADPQTIGLNRLQLQYKGLKNTIITVGRQRINLDDQRFVGSVNWRDNEQTFDAVRIETTPIKNLKADVTYAWSDNTVFGIDGQYVAKKGPVGTGHLNGDNVFGTLGYTTKLGTLEGFGYIVNQNEPFRTQFSSKTFGARFAGKYAFSKATSLAYTLSYANQSDLHLNPTSYNANYYYGDLALASHGFTIGGGYEVLGADTGAHTKTTSAATVASFQTPLATLHKWDGWADIFLVTPANGLADAYGSIGYTTTKVKPLTSLGASVIYHDYASDVASLHYGHEWDAQILAKLKKYTVTLKYADYTSANPALSGNSPNTKKFWASVEWAF